MSLAREQEDKSDSKLCLKIEHKRLGPLSPTSYSPKLSYLLPNFCSMVSLINFLHRQQMLLQIFFTTYSIENIVAAGSQTALISEIFGIGWSILELINNGSCQFIVLLTAYLRASVLAGTSLVLSNKAFWYSTCQRSQWIFWAPSRFSHLQDNPSFTTTKGKYCFRLEELESLRHRSLL